MLPELGLFCLILALCMAALQLGIYTTRLSGINIMRTITMGQSFFICLAFCLLLLSFYNDDFSVIYVAQNSNSTLPIYYKLTALWGAHEGSLLLWIFILNVWGLALALRSKYWSRDFCNNILVTFALTNFGFLLILLLASNPFIRTIFNIPIDGNDLNPLLQDIGMILHPPILYMGYVGCTVPFAFAIAGLITGKVDQNWAKMVQPWVFAAWIFLTLGIALGSWWAYYELGWGGWWFWDPVENASFMPWLTATALIHCLTLAKRTGEYLRLALFLSIVTFALSLFGTFLVRSGSIISVHAFANDPKRGLFILLLLALMLGASLLLFALRAPKLVLPNNPKSTNSILIFANNVFLLVASATILLGTLYPLFTEAVFGTTISVGYPYFNAVFIPIMLILFGVMLPGLLGFNFNFLITCIAACLVSIAFLFYMFGAIKFAALLGLTFALMIIATCFKTKNLSMAIAHLGLAVTIVGMSITPAYEIEKDLRLRVGDHLQIANYMLKFAALNTTDGPNYVGFKGTFNVEKHNKLIAVMHPEKRTYLAQETVMSETAIHTHLLQDIYIVLGQQIDANTWAVRVYYKPFVRCIWLGAIIMALGAALGLASVIRSR